MEITLEPICGNNQAQIQAAIDKCFLFGGGRVVLGSGTYESGAVRLRSNVTLYLCSGVLLKGTRNLEDYDILCKDILEPISAAELVKVEWKHTKKIQTEDGWMSLPGSEWNYAIVRILNAENVSVIGENGAVIDGSNCFNPSGEEHFRGPHGISIANSKNVVCKGYTIQHTGNWAHNGRNSMNVRFDGITVLGGHDGVHFSGCDNVTVENCKFYTGDDCVGGFDNNNTVVRNCIINTACSAFRFGGRDLLVENCDIYGPSEYALRCGLSDKDKEEGNADVGCRQNLLSVFTYYADFTYPIREIPGKIVLRNCTCRNVDRVFQLNYSGSSRWQCNKPLESIAFESISVEGVRYPLVLYGGKENPLSFSMKNCNVSFAKDLPEALQACNYREIRLDDVSFNNCSGDLIRTWSNDGEIILENVRGIFKTIVYTDEEFYCKPI